MASGCAGYSTVVELNEAVVIASVCNIMALAGQIADVRDDSLELVDVLAGDQNVFAEDCLTKKSVQGVPPVEKQHQGVWPKVDPEPESRRVLGSSCI